jgi:mycothiol synthase
MSNDAIHAHGWSHRESLSPSERLEVLALLDRVETETSRESLDETRRRAVVHGWPTSHWLSYQGTSLTGYAQSSSENVLSVEMAGGHVDDSLLATLRQRSAVINWWTRNGHIHAAAKVIRSLQLLTISLPVELVSPPHDVAIRTFEPSRDEEPWLLENNRAFADHPEQGAWTLEDLRSRTSEPWFDPSGFLLLTQDDNIVASCWTRVHELHPERFGEIYVISVDPKVQGRGLGRVALSQGLNHLRRRGVSRVELFVDESNDAARAMYERIGFTLHRVDHLLQFS